MNIIIADLSEIFPIRGKWGSLVYVWVCPASVYSMLAGFTLDWTLCFPWLETTGPLHHQQHSWYWFYSSLIVAPSRLVDVQAEDGKSQWALGRLQCLYMLVDLICAKLRVLVEQPGSQEEEELQCKCKLSFTLPSTFETCYKLTQQNWSSCHFLILFGLHSFFDTRIFSYDWLKNKWKHCCFSSNSHKYEYIYNLYGHKVNE